MQTPFKKIKDVKDLKGKRILLRLDLNVPIIGEEVRDDFRIRRSLPTLQLLHDAGARVIIISHLENEAVRSLSRVAAYIGRFIEVKAFIAKLDDAPLVIN